jgi:hypothetical protein
MDEAMARLVSQREGITVVLSGTIERVGTGYRIVVNVIDPVPGTVLATVPGTVLATAEATAATKADVLQAVGTLAGKAQRRTRAQQILWFPLDGLDAAAGAGRASRPSRHVLNGDGIPAPAVSAVPTHLPGASA